MIFSLLNRVFAIVLVLAVVALALIVGFRSIIDREKSSPFECGFDPKHSARISFSLRFFLLAVIFLIFDVEIVFFFPMSFMVLRAISGSIVFLRLITLFILLLGLFHEWREGSLDWSE